MSLALRYAARSDRGLIRDGNEDSVYAGPRLLAVADGMGGHVAGEVASKIVIGALARLDEDRPTDDPITELRDATEDANEHLRQLVVQDPNLEGMGTTLTAMLFLGSRIGLVHVGDSRAYLLRGGQLMQITHDDTFVQALIDEGRLTEEEASSHPQRSLILRALNGTDVEPDLSIREARIGDRYLLCTDGLSGVVSAETMLEALHIPDPQQCADHLVELALRGGGPDNVTCIVADVIDVEYGDDAPVVDGAAGGNIGQRDPADSPAARAAASQRQSRLSPPDDGPVRRRRRRSLLFALIVLVVLAGGLYGLYRWTQTQYFVGADGDEVAVYRGVNAAVGPVKLYSVVHTSGLWLDDLQQVARRQVESGIGAANRSEADRILSNLDGQTLPTCQSLATPPPSPTPSPTPAKTTPKSTAKPPAKTTPPARTTPPATTVTPTPTDQPIPGQDCREPH
ncbi:MAG TPA: PP2C family serine/threonine-protein phosphatase [Mycobacteriales bacterium]|nr:PP2C family serine/threonine-protein phosphatase [Mycobacteriales bacterium]